MLLRRYILLEFIALNRIEEWTDFTNEGFLINDKVVRDFAGLGDFLDMEVQGIIYKNIYYIVPSVAQDLRLHFMNWFFLAQWKALDVSGFLQRYISEVQSAGYNEAPLEKLAYIFDHHLMR